MNPLNEIKDAESYRDHLTTVDDEGKRKWIFPVKPSGKYYRARTYVSWVLLAVLFGLPLIKINGEPFFLFNILERKFILFSIVFTPQDLHLFALAMITMFVFIALFTVVFGRLFCGWACPQTIFMEMVFRKIEYAIDGDANAQRRLTEAPWDINKLTKRILKHAIFFAIAVLIANVFLSYIIGADSVFRIISEPVGVHFGGFIAMLIFSGIFYFVFTWFREQVCTNVCPYGRMQSVLLVPDSVIVHYDFVRGEPRGKLHKPVSATVVQPVLGDCIDCKLCVRVCPTGIDIRNGTQLECVNCTACMDACDSIMDKIERPKGLIRYDSLNGIKSGKRKILTPRAIGYSAILALLLILQGFLFGTRSEVETIILRTPGMLYQKIDDTHYSNLYNYQVINKTSKEILGLEFRLVGEGRVRLVGEEIPPVQKQSMTEGAFFIELPVAALSGSKTMLSIDVYAHGKLIETVKTNFLGPIK